MNDNEPPESSVRPLPIPPETSHRSLYLLIKKDPAEDLLSVSGLTGKIEGVSSDVPNSVFGRYLFAVPVQFFAEGPERGDPLGVGVVLVDRFVVRLGHVDHGLIGQLV